MEPRDVSDTLLRLILRALRNAKHFGRRGRLAVLFCVVWNAVVVLSIVWFIVSIETTIRWNNVQGVNTIESTGQLLPTILGAVSMARVLKRLVLLVLGKVSPLIISA